MSNANELDKLISVGNVVRVAGFTFDFPDGKSFPLSGMEGVVTDLFSEDADQIRSTHAQIRWTAETIRSISERYVDACVESDFCWTATVIPLDALETIVGAVSDEIEYQWTLNDKAAELFWSGAPEGRKLNALFKTADRRIFRFPGDAMLDYLRGNVRLPMPVALRGEPDADGESDGEILEPGTKASLVGLVSYDVRLNVYAEISVAGKNFILPLEDIEATERPESKNARALNLYLYWLVSRL